MQSAWRLGRRRWLAQLRSQLSPLQDPVASLRSYISRLAGTDAAAAAAAAAAAPLAAQSLAAGDVGGNGSGDGATVPRAVGDALVATAGTQAHAAAAKLLQVGVPQEFPFFVPHV